LARYFLNKVEERLQQIQPEAKTAEEEMNKIYEKYITKRCDRMHVDVGTNKSREDMF
jgi:hypothetical protein